MVLVRKIFDALEYKLRCALKNVSCCPRCCLNHDLGDTCSCSLRHDSIHSHSQPWANNHGFLVTSDVNSTLFQRYTIMDITTREPSSPHVVSWTRESSLLTLPLTPSHYSGLTMITLISDIAYSSALRQLFSMSRLRRTYEAFFI